MSGIVGKAVRQLASSSRFEHDFRVVWFTGAGVWADEHCLQFIARLFGTTHIIDPGYEYLRLCYFFYDSDFYRFATNLDAAIVAHDKGDSVDAKLCLNPLSPRYGLMRSSRLARAFHRAIEDPLAEENSGAFVADCDMPRTSTQPGLHYLQEKYRTKPLMNMDPARVEYTVLLPRSANTDPISS
jgi:hypothetical protein